MADGAEIERLEGDRERCERERQAHEQIARAKAAVATAADAVTRAKLELVQVEPDRRHHSRLMTAAMLRPVQEECARVRDAFDIARGAFAAAVSRLQAAESAWRESDGDLQKSAEAARQADESMRCLAPEWDKAAALDALITVSIREREAAQKNHSDSEREAASRQHARDQITADLAAKKNEYRSARDECDRVSELKLLAKRWAEVAPHLEKRRECVDMRRELLAAQEKGERERVHLRRSVEELRTSEATERNAAAALWHQISERQPRLGGHVEAELRSREATLARLKELVADLIRYAEEWRAAQQAARLATQDLGYHTTRLTQAAHAKEIAEAKLGELRGARRTLQPSVDLTDTLGSPTTAELRSKLIPGHPCPVCGSIDHRPDAPEIEALAAKIRASRLELDEAIAATETSANDARDAMADARAHATAAESQYNEAATAMTKAQEAYRAAHTAFAEANSSNLLKEKLPAIVGEAEAVLPQVLDEANELFGQAAAKITTLAGLRSEIEDLRGQRDELLATAANHTRNREGDEQRLRENEVADARRAMQLTNVNDRIDSIDREWGPLLAAAGVVRDDLDSNPAGSIRRLEHEATRIANLLSESERLDSAIRLLEPQVAAAQTATAEAAAALERAQTEFEAREGQLVSQQAQRVGLLGGEETTAHRRRHEDAQRFAHEAVDTARLSHAACTNAVTEARTTVQGAKEALSRAEQEADDAGRRMDNALAKHSLSSDELVALLSVPPDEVMVLEQRLRSVEQAVLTARVEKAAREGDLRTACANEPRQPLDELLAKITAHTTTINELRGKLGSVNEALRRDDAARRRDAELARELDAAKGELKVWAEVHAAIGQADGSKFQRFAQRVTLVHLVHLANKHLAVLTPRYLLERAPGETLGLQVWDRDMGDERRATMSLSGGETFLVSLALALALSTLEGRETFVDTIFIDEGFSSLDAETLEVAIDALERLPSTGRQVGVISHVDALQQRIPVQVLVEQRGGGTSRVRVVGGAPA
jgi:exonuclease SbcC